VISKTDEMISREAAVDPWEKLTTSPVAIGMGLLKT
jgi:hypothetical protein